MSPHLFHNIQKRIATLAVGVLLASLLPSVAEASSWGPTLLVNTEAFQIIDDGDGSTNIELRFGDSANEILRWDVTNARFQFTDDVHVEGNLTASGSITVDGAAVFGSTLTVGGVAYTFPGADGSASGKVLATNSAGQLSWTAQTASPDLFKTFAVSGQNSVVADASTDTLTLAEGSNITITTNDTTDTITIAATDTNTTYVAGQGVTLTADSENAFSVNSTLTGTLIDFNTVSGAIVHARDQLRSSGTLLIDGAATFNSTLDTVGNMTTDGTLQVNDDDTGNAQLIFGNDAGDETITFNDGTNEFDISDDVNITGTLDVTGTVTTDANLSINVDQTAANAVFTFGSDGTNETLTFYNAEDRFEFSDDLATTGNLTASGSITVDGAAVFGSTLTIGGVAYTFPGADGSASGKVLATNSAGQLSWTSAAASDTNTTYVAGQGVTLTADSENAFSVNSTLTGTLIDFNTVSGAIVHARDQLRSSGTLLIDGAATFNSTLDTVGNMTTDGTLQVNDDDTGNAQLIFGNDAGDETITFNDGTNEFDISDDVNITGTLDVTGTVTTDANLSINVDQTAANAVFTFGSDGTNETLTFYNAEDRFEFSDDLATTGNLTASGSITVDGAAVFGSTLTIGGVAYTFPGADGSASGKILATDGAGNLAWTSIKNGSGNTVALSPDYPNAVYYASGSTAVGQLFASGGNLTSLENNYTWKTTQSALQDYWVSTRVKIPHNFANWAPTPIQFRFKTGTPLLTQNYVSMKLYDTAGALVPLGTGALAGSNWTTANITGPESTGTYTPDSYITVMVKLAATNATAAQANAGSISLNWNTTNKSG